jgi:uroporphyrinogen decarboxylase
MTSKERVLKTFQHKEPDMVPRWCGSSPEFWQKAKNYTGLSSDEDLNRRFGDDFRRVYSVFKGPEEELHEDATWRSPFGVERTGLGYGQPTSHPLAKAASLKDIETYAWPSHDWIDVSAIQTQTDPHKDTYAILGGEWSPFWHDAIDLVGHENLYYLMYDNPAAAEALFEHITDYYYEGTKKSFETTGKDIDIFFIGNDLGGQTGPLIGVEGFRQFVLPSLKRLINLGHAHDKQVLMHCCGGFRQLIPDLIDAGLDGLHALQPDCAGMDPAGLKRDFGKDIVLNGAVDSHNILITGPSPEFVYAETAKILHTMKPGGGYICSASHDYILEETPVENVLAMFNAVKEFGLYS